jgi:hypothetical protein
VLRVGAGSFTDVSELHAASISTSILGDDSCVASVTVQTETSRGGGTCTGNRLGSSVPVFLFLLSMALKRTVS